MIQLLLPVIGKVLDRILPDTVEADKVKLELTKMAMEGELKELDHGFELAKANLLVNQKEAEHSDIFVSGWRPAVGWCCTLAFGWSFIARDLVILLATLAGSPLDPELLPRPDLTEMLPILIGMLGLGGMRSVERINRVQRNKL